MRIAATALLLTLGVLSLATIAHAEPPASFEACPQDTSFANSATIYVPNTLQVTIQDSLQTGDQIALFTSDGTCAGVSTWDGAPLTIAAYGADAWSDFGGYEPQEDLQFKIWDASRQTIYIREGTYAACTESIPAICKDDGRYAVDAFYTLAGLSVGSLPVELTSFEATRDQEAIVLNWHTASEIDNEGFEVQHAVGDASFSKEAFVDGAAAPGEGQSYSLRVETSLPGRHRFRLKQVDVDGDSTYSSVVELRTEMTEPFSLESPAPNPFTTRASFRLIVAREQVVRVAVYDVLGRRVALLYDGPLEAGTPHRFTFEGASYSSGLYLIRASGETFQAVRKAVLVR